MIMRTRALLPAFFISGFRGDGVQRLGMQDQPFQARARGWNGKRDGHRISRRPPGRVWVVGVAGVVGCVAGTVCRGEFDSERHLLFHVGGVSLRPQLEVAGAYDSNLFYQEEDEEGDFITSVRPGLRIQYGTQDANYLSLRYTADASFYAERSDLDNLGHVMVHQSRFDWDRLRWTASDRFVVTRSLLGGTFSYIEKRVGLKSLDANWGVDYAMSPKMLAGVKLGMDWADYDAADLAPQHLYDYLMLSTGVRVGYQPSDRITVFPEFTFSRTDLGRNSSTVAEAPSMSGFAMALGAEGEFTPKLTGVVTGGYEIREYDDDSEIPDGWVSSFQVRWDARAKTAVTVGYRHMLRVSRELTGYSYTVYRPEVAVVQQLGTQGRWTASLDGYYEFNDYDRDIQVGGEWISRSDRMWGTAVRATYRWQPWLTTSASYEFRTYDGNVPGIQDYEVHRFSLRLAAGY